MSSTNEHRLPTGVTPSAYQLLVRTAAADDHFNGSVHVELVIHEPTRQLVCHAAQLEIHTVGLAIGAEPTPVRFRLDGATERLIIDLDADLPPGVATLHIDFSGRFNENLVGMYRSDYEHDGEPATMTVTQFEAPHARRVFPCWDEPAFKATFAISIECDEGLVAISNSRETARTPLGDGMVRVDFATTMRMSTDLVAWVIGDLEVSPTVTVGDTDIRVIHRPGRAHLTAFALECAAHAVEWFEEYYGIAFPGDKLDLVAVPDFAFGAMENLGCVTFREVLLLIDPERSNRAEQERAATVIEHEIAHMWFGNLVTMEWWNGIWLNEAFATFMEFCCADAFRPDWDIWTSFGLSKSAAFATDTLASTRPIEFDVATPSEADAMFDILTYEKGASILRMFERWAGPDRFRDGVRRYLTRHLYENTNTADLWAALSEAAGVNVGSIMDSWILQGGHPVVTVESTPTGIRLRQQRCTYLGAADASSSLWKIPMNIQVMVHGLPDTRSVLFDGDEFEIDLGGPADWVLANSEFGGFFRTLYDPRLRTALLGRAAELSQLDRYALLDDAWALCLAGQQDLAATLEVVTTIAELEDNPSVWRRIAGILDALQCLLPTDQHDALAELTNRLVAPRLESSDGELLGVLFRLSGTVGRNADTQGRAAALVATLRSSTEQTGNPELDAAALDVFGASAGDKEFDDLLDMFRAAPTNQDELRALNALGRSGHPHLIERFCEMCLAEVRIQNAPYALAAAMANSTCGPQVWGFVADNWERIVRRFNPASLERLAGGVRSFSEPGLAAEVHAFFEAHPLPQAPRQLEQHLERLRVNVAVREHLADSLAKYLDDVSPLPVRD